MYCPTENDALYTAKRRDTIGKENATRVAGCRLRLRPESYPQHTVEAISTQNATRNLFGALIFFFPIGATLWVGSFFYFLYIIYNM